MTGSNGFVALTVRGKGLTGPAALTRDASSNTFTVGTGELMTLGITEGSYAIVSDKAVASNGPNLPPIETQQVVKITDVNGDTATIEGNFAHNVTLPSFQNPFFSLNIRNGSTKSSVSASKIGSNQSSDVVRFSRK